MSLHYHPGKDNVVDDALSRLSIGSLAYVDEDNQELVKDIHCLPNLGVLLLDSGNGGVFVQEVVKSSFVAEIKRKLVLDSTLMKIKRDVDQQKVIAFETGGDGILRYQGGLCVPDVDGLRERILVKAHKLFYDIHPSSQRCIMVLRRFIGGTI